MTKITISTLLLIMSILIQNVQLQSFGMNPFQFGQTGFNQISPFGQTGFNQISPFGQTGFNQISPFGQTGFNQISPFEQTGFKQISPFGQTGFNQFSQNRFSFENPMSTGFNNFGFENGAVPFGGGPGFGLTYDSLKFTRNRLLNSFDRRLRNRLG